AVLVEPGEVASGSLVALDPLEGAGSQILAFHALPHLFAPAIHDLVHGRVRSRKIGSNGSPLRLSALDLGADLQQNAVRDLFGREQDRLCALNWNRSEPTVGSDIHFPHAARLDFAGSPKILRHEEPHTPTCRGSPVPSLPPVTCAGSHANQS